MSLANDSLEDDMVKLVAYTIVTLERGNEDVVDEGTVIVTERMSGDAFTAWMIARYLQSLKYAPALPPGVQDQLDRLSARMDRDEIARKQQACVTQDKFKKMASWAGQATTTLNELTGGTSTSARVDTQTLLDQLQEFDTWIAASIQNLNDRFVQPAASGTVREQITDLRAKLGTLLQKQLTTLGEWVDQTRQALSTSQAKSAATSPAAQTQRLAPPDIATDPQPPSVGNNSTNNNAAQPAAPVRARRDLQYLRVYFVVSNRWPREPLKFHENQVRTLQDIRSRLHCQ
jgi:hypothetical protein